MIIARTDLMILRQKEVRELRGAYRKKFHEDFRVFNYGDFRGTDSKPAAAFYVEALREALQKDEPTRYEGDPWEPFGH